jgi:hypothetical protein
MESACSGNIMYSHMKMEKMRPVETIQEWIKENDGEGEFKYEIL